MRRTFNSSEYSRSFRGRPPKIVTDGQRPAAARPSSFASKCLLCGGLLLCLFYGGHHGLALPRPHAAEESSQNAPAPNIEESPRSENRCWIFNHLQKAGGTTVKRLLFDSWGSKSTTYDSYQWKKGQAYAESLASSLASPAGWSAVAGGYLEALRRTPAFQPDDERTPCRWFTVFRHPVSRLVSAYYYCREDPSDQLCASEFVSSRNVDLVTFARHWGNFALRQFALGFVSHGEVKDFLVSPNGGGAIGLTEEQVELMPGWYMLKLFLNDRSGVAGDTSPEESRLEYMVKPVVDLLRDNYAVVGILEDWNATLSLFDSALDMPGMTWHEEFERSGKLNVDTRFKGEKQVVLQQALSDPEIEEHLSLDLRLYRQAVDIFNQQRHSYGIAQHGGLDHVHRL
ncbi:unnamed protein product [Ectocarpus sp. 4 AP-2014]